MDNNLRIEDLHFKIGDIIELDYIDNDIGELGIEYIFSENEVFNLQIDYHKDNIIGSYSIDINDFDGINIEFITTNGFTVIDNSENSNIYLSVIDRENLKVRITNIEYI
jgi:hypothetical protein